MGDSIIASALSGLKAAQLGLATTGHNISNASTPGYSRQETLQAANPSRFTGAGYLGQGVSVATVRRNYSEVLDAQLRNTQAQSSQFDAHYEALKQIDDLLADPQVGLSPALEAFFGATHDLAARPADIASRQSMLEAGQSLVARMRSIDGRLLDARADMTARIRSSVGAINSYANQIFNLNNQIVLAGNRGANSPPNDLLDQRDQLLRQLSKEVNISVVKQGSGAVQVFMGSGQALVTQERAYVLTTSPSPFDASEVQVGLDTGASVVTLRPADLGGGALAAYFAFRDGSLASAQSSLGRLALALGDGVNSQHRLGQDRNGVPGGDFFSVAAPTVLGSSANVGSASLSVDIADFGQLVPSDYQLRFDGVNYDVMRLSDGSSRSFGALPISMDGLDIQSTAGAMAAGDTFEIRPMRHAATSITALLRDPAKIAAGAPIIAASANTNHGAASVSMGEVSGGANPNLLAPVTINFTSPTTFNVTGTGTGNPTGLTYTPGAAIAFNGWSITIDGAAAVGDRFTVGPNLNGVGDNRNALKLAQLQTAPMLDAGHTTLQQAYAQLVSHIGNATREQRVGSESQANLLQLTTQTQQAAAGVNLDEEAVNLMRYQQAYQAAGKVIGVAQRLFEDILSIGR
jgi:flagellar hook-associated protein 1